MLFIKRFCVSFFSFIILDFLWLGFVVKDFNLAQLAAIGSIEDGNFAVNYPAAIGAYFFMALAVAFFVIPKLDSKSSIVKIFLCGAFMGVIVYGVFDMTNLAILRDYPTAFVLADMAWGTVVYGLVSVITHKIIRRA